MNIGMLDGMTAAVRVTGEPPEGRDTVVRAASGSVLVISAVLEDTAGASKKELAVMNWYCESIVRGGWVVLSVIVVVGVAAILESVIPGKTSVILRISLLVVTVGIARPVPVSVVVGSVGRLGVKPPSVEVGSSGGRISVEVVEFPPSGARVGKVMFPPVSVEVGTDPRSLVILPTRPVASPRAEDNPRGSSVGCAVSAEVVVFVTESSGVGVGVGVGVRSGRRSDSASVVLFV
jgi:hypothetical protein